MKYALMSMLMLATLTAQAETETLTWIPPATWLDGSPLAAAAITGYEIDCSAQDTALDCTSKYPNVTVAGTVTTYIYDVGVIPAAGIKLCFHVRALVALPNMPSDYSPSVCKTFPPPPRKASMPTGVTVK